MRRTTSETLVTTLGEARPSGDGSPGMAAGDSGRPTKNDDFFGGNDDRLYRMCIYIYIVVCILYIYRCIDVVVLFQTY